MKRWKLRLVRWKIVTILCRTQGKHCIVLSESMHKHGFEYWLCMMMVIFWANGNPASRPVDVIFHEENGQKVVKDGYSLVIPDCRHGHAAVDIFRKTGEHLWIDDQVQMRIIMHRVSSQRVRASIKQAGVSKLSKVHKKLLAIVWKDKLFVDKVKAVVNYMGGFKLEFGARFVDAYVKDTFPDKTSSEYLLSKMCPTYVRSSRFPCFVCRTAICPICWEVERRCRPWK